LQDFFAVSQFLIGDDPWAQDKYLGDEWNGTAQQAAYAYSLASNLGVNPSQAATLTLLREAGMLYQESVLEPLLQGVSPDLCAELNRFYKVEGKTDEYGMPRKHLGSSFNLSASALSDLRESSLTRVVLDAELAWLLTWNLWYEFYDYARALRVQIGLLAEKTAHTIEDKNRISDLDKDLSARVIFISRSEAFPNCQFGNCEEAAAYSIICPKCSSCEQLCSRHATRAKNDVWGYWNRFSKSCGHNVEMRDCSLLKLTCVQI
jgi:hypothetical protein